MIWLYRSTVSSQRNACCLGWVRHPLHTVEIHLAEEMLCSWWMPHPWAKVGRMMPPFSCTYMSMGGLDRQTTNYPSCIRPQHTTTVPLCCETWQNLKWPRASYGFSQVQHYSYQHYGEQSQTYSVRAWALDTIWNYCESFQKERRTHKQPNGFVFNQRVNELLNQEPHFHGWISGFNEKNCQKHGL